MTQDKLTSCGTAEVDRCLFRLPSGRRRETPQRLNATAERKHGEVKGTRRKRGERKKTRCLDSFFQENTRFNVPRPLHLLLFKQRIPPNAVILH